MRQGVDVCDMRMIKCEALDDKVLEIFKSIQADKTTIYRFAKTKKKDDFSGTDPAAASARVKACEDKIEKLTASLALASGSTAMKYIVAELERLDMELQALRREQAIALSEDRKRSAAELSVQERARAITEKLKNFDEFTATEKNAIAREVLKKCTWDGESLFIEL